MTTDEFDTKTEHYNAYSLSTPLCFSRVSLHSLNNGIGRYETLRVLTQITCRLAQPALSAETSRNDSKARVRTSLPIRLSALLLVQTQPPTDDHI